MPIKLRDGSPERRRERRERTRPEKEKSEKDRAEKKERHHRSSTHRTSSTKEKSASRTSLSSVESKQRVSMPGILKVEDDASNPDSKANLPYPTFSKAHSKEAVGSHPSLNIFTPPATDVDGTKEKLSSSKPANIQNGPPSPPLTDKTAGRPVRPAAKSTTVDTIPEEEKNEVKKKESGTALRHRPSKTDSRLRSSSEASPVPLNNKPKERVSTPLKKVETPITTPQRSVSQPTRTASPTASASGTELTVNGSSNATSIAPEQPSVQRPGSKAPPVMVIEDGHSPVKSFPQSFSRQQTPLEIIGQTPSPALTGPPPPPPPPVMPAVVPRVDYLLHHGGLNQAIPRNLLFAGKPMAVQQAQINPSQPPIVVANLFEPYNSLLGDFEKVVAKNGSLAVATGYKSVARRLLDRLENVFARDISSESCGCSLCAKESQLEDSRAVSWGEILELVSGRRELPNWPPFTFVAAPSGLGISLEMHTPMQKVDVDVPEEYREHYIRQSRKTKQSVDKWLSRQGDDPSSPPEEVDDETLTFSILTHLPAEQRQSFKNLLGIVDRPLGPPRRAPSPDSKGQPQPIPTPQPRERSEHIVIAANAIQRLYRLGTLPRDPETAIYLLNNTTLHNTLATLAAISDDEWDILTSGRFDGFLRSGAEDLPDQQSNGRYTPARGPSRNHRRQNSYPSRQATPAMPPPQYGAPIALDEETEIATLTEIEREIYTGMEALEDAFEALHQRAEAVRRALRERSAGLAATAQRRRGTSTSNVEIRTDTPASLAEKWESETDDGLGDWDGVSEIAPDDSASNISSARRRRPKRRNERRTPALIEEDDEDYAESEGTSSPRKR